MMPVVIRPMRLPAVSANQTASSGPAVMPCASPGDDGIAKCVMTPAGVIRPIRENSVNQTFPSGPAPIPWRRAPSGGFEDSLMTPAVVIRPICEISVNHRLRSGPAAMSSGCPPDGIGN